MHSVDQRPDLYSRDADRCCYSCIMRVQCGPVGGIMHAGRWRDVDAEFTDASGVSSISISSSMIATAVQQCGWIRRSSFGRVNVCTLQLMYWTTEVSGHVTRADLVSAMHISPRPWPCFCLHQHDSINDVTHGFIARIFFSAIFTPRALYGLVSFLT